eukprot:SAG22_NODE_255_length_13562_cov_6.101463_8_plen_79_part_00
MISGGGREKENRPTISLCCLSPARLPWPQVVGAGGQCGSSDATSTSAARADGGGVTTCAGAQRCLLDAANSLLNIFPL